MVDGLPAYLRCLACSLRTGKAERRWRVLGCERVWTSTTRASPCGRWSPLEELPLSVCERAAGFLKQSLTQQASVVDFFSLLYACLLIQTHAGIDVLAELHGLARSRSGHAGDVSDYGRGLRQGD